MVLDNTPKCKKVLKHPFPDNIDDVHSTKSFAVPWADWAMISNRPGYNIKREVVISISIPLTQFTSDEKSCPPAIEGEVTYKVGYQNIFSN